MCSIPISRLSTTCFVLLTRGSLLRLAHAAHTRSLCASQVELRATNRRVSPLPGLFCDRWLILCHVVSEVYAADVPGRNGASPAPFLLL